jgi:uncharacterized protein (DUF952 family)
MSADAGTDLDDGEHIFHIALASDWAAAAEGGDYRTSTLGRTLDEEGFIHASRRHQVDGVRRLFYAQVTEPMVLLEIDPQRLPVPWRLEVPPGAAEAFPHIFGPLPVDAVVAVHPQG